MNKYERELAEFYSSEHPLSEDEWEEKELDSQREVQYKKVVKKFKKEEPHGK